MIIHFQILDKTLCGAEYQEPSEEQAKNGKLCHDCIQVMWKEEYRRNTLLPYIKKHGVSVKEKDELAEKLKKKQGVVVEQPKLSPPRPIKSLRQYMKVKT
jgi:hypothetical protein|tara:strand:- start:141 stop:440 length:300 start_codon:yes stop_codon:yes gene_type:complete